MALTIGADGAIYVGGYSEGSLHGQTSNGGVDAFISRYDSNGNRVWTKLLGSPSYEAANTITLGSNGNLYLVGYTEGSLDGQSNSGGRDIFISQYLPDSTKVSTRLLGTSAADLAKGVVGTSDGAFYLTGDTSGNLNGQINNGGSSDIFLAKLVNTLSTNLVVITASDATAGETNNPGQFTLTRTGSTAAPLTVNLTRTGTTAHGTDYITNPATVSFVAGSSTTVIDLTVTDDLLVEGNETVTFTVTGGTGYTVGATATATVTINDNDFNGTSGADNLLGDTGQNVLNGLAGNDTLNGGANNDIVNGGPGTDTLTSGTGSDTLIFQFGQSLSAAPDQVTDFAIGTDKIDLLTAGGLAMAAPTAFTRAANHSATTLATVISNVFTDANGGLAGNQGLGLNSAALVVATAGAIAGTYLVVNDGSSGFQAATDLVINLTGYTGILPALGTITLSTWFV
jgi:Ca2+-binding RTX toxin-like protein